MKSLVHTILILTVVSCSAEAPDIGFKDDEPKAPGQTSREDGDPEERPVITIQDYTVETRWDTVVIRGTGPAGATIVFSSPRAGQRAETIGPDGEFCLDVALLTDDGSADSFGVDNDISLFAQAGNLSSNPIKIVVTQRGYVPPDPEDEPLLLEVENQALGQQAELHRLSVYQGTLASVTDGDRSSGMRAEVTGFTGATRQLRIPVKAQDGANVESIRVVMPADCDSTYWLYHTDLDDPPLMGPSNGDITGWTQVANAFTSEPPNKLYLLTGVPAVKWVGIVFNPGSCSTFFGGTNVGLNEIEINGTDIIPETQVPPVNREEAPSCRDLNF